MSWIPWAVMGASAIFGAASKKSRLNKQKKAYYADPRWALRKALIDSFYGEHADFREKYPGLYETLTNVPEFQMPSKWDRVKQNLGGLLGQSGKQYVADNPEKYSQTRAPDDATTTSPFAEDPTPGASSKTADKPDCIGRPPEDPDYQKAPCLPQVLG
jgi:hypothetical protein